MSAQFLRGVVVAILDDQRLLINVGMKHGVSVGDRFVIYEEGNEITDPSTGQSLGKLELVKALLEATHVQDLMTLVMPFQKETTTQSTVLSAVLAQTNSSSFTTDIYRDRLNVKKQEVLGLPHINATISCGDPVRSIKSFD